MDDLDCGREVRRIARSARGIVGGQDQKTPEPFSTALKSVPDRVRRCLRKPPKTRLT